MKKEVIIALALLIVIMIVVGGIFVATKLTNNEQVAGNVEESENSNEKSVEKTKDIKIFNGNKRAIAFMIDNNVNAQPQSAINNAYIVYEIIVEGNETRLMAVFKDVDEDIVGPMRSARHYFLDYAMENDAIYAHLGLSPQADADMQLYRTNNINGQVYDTGKARTESSKYWRDTKRSAPHNAYTNTSKILEIAKEKGYKTTSNKESVLNYVEKEVKLDSGITANTISIPYSDSHIVKYTYDEAEGRYIRHSKGKKQTDASTGDDITTKNIIITFAKNYTLNDGEGKGRQDVVTTGSLKGYYITNGKAIEITCKKNVREEQTQYLDKDGNVIEVNDGNTFINVCPIDADVVIE